ncbi:hypothetical protein [Marinicellulosiphila megalodicopiae]|uniref:hypothetical protein n=1 Tax=Marinicellulosiphila megalodicopiae TaxID=2724896 RepID=UPI003BB004BB
MSDVWEIVQLESGEIALREAQGNKEPLMVVKFPQQDSQINEQYIEVAKAMLNSGMETLANIQEQEYLEQTMHNESDFVH